MIMTSLAMTDITVRRRWIRDCVMGFIGLRGDDGDIVCDMAHHAVRGELNDRPITVVLPAPGERNLWRWRRHPALRAASGTSPMSDNERQARHSAIHGLYAGLGGDVEDASAWFLQAVSIHDIDLTDIPSFWHMPRAAIEAAAVAYECVGRFREAAMVQARLRTEFRPRNIVELRAPAEVNLALEVAAR